MPADRPVGGGDDHAVGGGERLKVEAGQAPKRRAGKGVLEKLVDAGSTGIGNSPPARKLAVSPECKNLVRLFRLGESVRRRPPALHHRVT